MTFFMCADDDVGRRGKGLVLMVGASLGVLGVAASLPAQHSPHGAHPPMPNQALHFHCNAAAFEEGFEVEVPLKLASPLQSVRLSQDVALPSPRSPVRLERYFPQATLKQTVIADPSAQGRPAVKLRIEGPAQEYERWLVAGDPARNRLTSFIATWRLMAVADREQRDALLEQFERELTRPPTLRVRRPEDGKVVELPLKQGRDQVVDEIGCKIRVREFYPDFGRDTATRKPVNKSEMKLNPAVLVDIELGNLREERWVFAKFPGFSQGDGSLPVHVALDCPIEHTRRVPDFALVAVEGSGLEVWARLKDKTRIESAAKDDTFAITGSQYRFRIADFVPSGRMVETYESARRGVAALQVEFKDQSGKPSTIWLELGKPRTVMTEHGAVVVSFGPSKAPSGGDHP